MYAIRKLCPCPCGSGELRSEEYDARGIFLYFYCSQCEAGKREKYRPEVFSDSRYWTDEPVEPEDSYGDPGDEYDFDRDHP